jgi:hypothetical protein
MRSALCHLLLALFLSFAFLSLSLSRKPGSLLSDPLVLPDCFGQTSLVSSRSLPIEFLIDRETRPVIFLTVVMSYESIETTFTSASP